MKLLKKDKRGKKMEPKEYAKWIFWISLTVILLSTLTGS